MATRDRWRDFSQYRVASNQPQQPLQSTISIEPLWVESRDAIQAELRRITDLTDVYEKLVLKSVRIVFDDEAESNVLTDIEQQKRVLQDRLNRVSNAVDNLQRFQRVIPNAKESTVVSNVLRVLTKEVARTRTRFQQITRTFRHNEKLKNAELDEEIESVLNETPLTDHSDIYSAQEEIKKNENDEMSAIQRSIEINKLAESTQDLATIFKDLNAMVVDQGLILNRIDYNIENALVHTEKSVEELKIAEQYSRKNYVNRCIVVLFVIVLILTVILIVKYSSR